MRVVPKGLRAFDLEDADFFLSLLPGPRDRDGLPESIRAWKTRIDQTDPSQVVPGGAALRPFRVRQVVAGQGRAASATGCSYRTGLCRGLRRRHRAAPARGPQAEVSRYSRKPPAWSRPPPRLREGTVQPPDTKVLIVLDQFEQWLHHHLDDPGSELLQAIRQCDGRRLQATGPGARRLLDGRSPAFCTRSRCRCKKARTRPRSSCFRPSTPVECSPRSAARTVGCPTSRRQSARKPASSSTGPSKSSPDPAAGSCRFI